MLQLDLNKSITTLMHVAQSQSHVQVFVTPWTVAHQAPLSMRFSRGEYQSGLTFPTPEIFMIQGSNLSLCISCTGRWDSLPLSNLGNPDNYIKRTQIKRLDSKTIPSYKIITKQKLKEMHIKSESQRIKKIYQKKTILLTEKYI